jgi:hypothetical protein
MTYVDFYTFVSEARDVTFFQNARSPSVIASRNNQEAFAGYVLENRTGIPNQVLFVQVEFDNTGRDNLLWLEYAFDKEAPRRILLSRGYDVAHQAQAVLRRDTPYQRLSLRAVLNCAAKEPSLEGANLQSLRFKGLGCVVCPADQEQACDRAAQDRLELSRLQNFLSEDFPGKSSVRQSTAASNTNIVIKPEGDRAGWSPYVPALQGEIAELRMRVRPTKDRLTFFPRLGTDSWLRVDVVEGSGKQRSLFYLNNPTQTWTPVGGHYEVAIPDDLIGSECDMVITFAGPWAQLWQLNNVVFF